MHLFFIHYPSSCRLAGFRSSKPTQLNVSSFICNLFSPSAVSPLQMTTSARPFPFRFVSSASVLLGFPLPLPVASSFFPSLRLPFRSSLAPFRILSLLFFLSALRRFRLPVAFPTPQAFLSVRSDFPLPYRLVSRSVFPVPLTQLSCLFPFTLP